MDGDSYFHLTANIINNPWQSISFFLKNLIFYRSTMLGRKSSFGGGQANQGPGPVASNALPGLLEHPSSIFHSTGVATNADYGPSDETHEGSEIVWINRTFTRRFLRHLQKKISEI